MRDLSKLRDVIKEYGLVGKQTFCSRNYCDDVMTNLYCEDGIILDYQEDWDYIELLGLSEQEYYSLSDILDIMEVTH